MHITITFNDDRLFNQLKLNSMMLTPPAQVAFEEDKLTFHYTGDKATFKSLWWEAYDNVMEIDCWIVEDDKGICTADYQAIRKMTPAEQTLLWLAGSLTTYLREPVIPTQEDPYAHLPLIQ